MTVLIELKEKLKEFYGSCSGIVLPIVKFLLALAVFRGINSNLGYLKMLNSMYVVLILSLICAILPLNGMVFLAMLVIIGHCFALHMVIAGLAALVLLVLWFLYLRFVPKDAPALLLTPLAFWLHVPSAVPVAYGLAGTPLSAFSAACGVVVYYMCDMIHGKMEPLLHAAEAPEITAVVQEFFNGLFRNEEMLLVLIACALTVLLVNAIRHSSADYAWQISIVAGSVAYAVIMIAGSLALDVQIALPMVLIGAAITAVVIIFQPELRRVVEQIGEKNPLSAISFASGQEENERFSDKTINELVRASFEMGEVKTGALIVIEKTITLEEYEKTGIPIDGVLTSQLLINIFEHNTPLHDGAVIVRNNRVTAATCYLPLSDNMDLNKNLGTRHRAGVGISEVTDSFTIIVSEETGNVSYASGGELHTAVTPSDLRDQLHKIQKLAKKPEEKKGWHIRGMRQKVEGEKK